MLAPRRIRIKIVGLGGGGSSIVSEMAQSLSGVSFVVADTDKRPVRGRASSKVKHFYFGEKLLAGMGTGMNPELASQAAMEEKEKIAKIFKDQDLVVLVGCLGGGVASGAGPLFAQTAFERDKSAITLGIFTLPFQFEGEKKMKLAQKAVSQLRGNLSAIIVTANEKIFQIVDKKTPLKKALSSLNQIFGQYLSDLIEIIAKPSLINIDFADLRTILKERGQTLYFSQAAAQGANRAEEINKRVFTGPLFGQAPANVKRILFNISGGKDLTLKEVETISQHIASLNRKAKIIFGISQQPNLAGRIKLTLLAVGEGEVKKNNESKKRKKKPIVLPKKSALKTLKKSLEKVKEVKPKEDKQKTRRSALEVKKTEEEDNEKEWAGGEPEWEIPAFLRKNSE